MTATLRGIALALAAAFAGCAEENENWGNPTEVCEAPAGFDGTSNQMRRWIERLGAELCDK